ncbi:hypothetical protein WH47_01671 [Habropoda laboriosa]|uniref:Uncharacterized protein n=1 Tax=Habropoda laboriosa TaxID=597456 RepID=A0A0L7QZT2_9HYME|nr:hypothetical protein WH47_01671 [Habropoda laboriosa]
MDNTLKIAGWNNNGLHQSSKAHIYPCLILDSALRAHWKGSKDDIRHADWQMQLLTINQSACPNKNPSHGQKFRTIIDEKLNCNISLKTPEQIEITVNYITQTIQAAAWTSTNTVENRTYGLSHPNYILQKIEKAMEFRRTRHPTIRIPRGDDNDDDDDVGDGDDFVV